MTLKYRFESYTGLDEDYIDALHSIDYIKKWMLNDGDNWGSRWGYRWLYTNYGYSLNKIEFTELELL